ncbi:MAG: hypothetical protein II372_00595 [Clostridia bacterium]|nr:hypothetical protein [Clostridia bacterium]
MEEKEINIADLFWLAWRRLWIIILAALICAGLALTYCEFIAEPSYKATASVLVTNGAIAGEIEATGDKVAATDVSASLYLADTITDILKTPDVYMQLSHELGGDYTYVNLMESFTISRRSDDSLFVDLEFVSGDPMQTMHVANTFAEIACQYVPEVIPYAYARVTATASKSTLAFPQTTTTTVIAALLGAVLAYAIAFVVEYTNSTLKGEEEFINKYNVPLLGSVPDFENADEDNYSKKGGRKYYYGKKY